MLKIMTLSNPTSIKKPGTQYNINLFYQFFIHSDSIRNHEITTCLRKNVENPHITNIYLLNERIYTLTELGLHNSNNNSNNNNNKITQIVIGRRLKYLDVFDYTLKNNIMGYIVIANADIFFDDTVKNVRISDIHIHKKMFAQLRFEYNIHRNLAQSVLFGPRTDSQDTWIVHSRFINEITVSTINNIFDFELGQMGCDNKIVYLMMVLGFEVLNDPFFIKTYHYHSTNIRNYTVNNRIPPPYAMIIPARITRQLPLYREIKNALRLSFNDNSLLYNYIHNKMETNKPFIIPRIAGIENRFAVNMYNKSKSKYRVYNQSTLSKMKKNAGINITNENDAVQYASMYLKAFENCEIYGGWNRMGHVYQQSQDIVEEWFLSSKMFCSFSFDIFHYIYSSTCWTKALRGKRLLIISPFEESICTQLEKRGKIYDGVDLFPECTFITIRSTQTQGDEKSESFVKEIAKFFKRVDAVAGTYDIALVSCGGYGNMVCNYIYEQHQKSAIYVGGVLQMYFGILGERWIRERPDIIKLFVDGNDAWTRPTESEKPKDFINVEGACYW